MEIIFLLGSKREENPPKLREDFVAGCCRVEDSDTEAICYAMTEIEEREGLDDMFTRGVVAAFSFISCPEGQDMHGTTFDEFITNAWRKTEDHIAIEQLLDKLTGGKE